MHINDTTKGMKPFIAKMASTQNTTPAEDSFKGEEEAYSYAMQLATFSALPMTLKAAIDLGVLDIIAKAGTEGKYLSTKEIAKDLSANNPDAPLLLQRMLNLLASYNIFTCIDETENDGITITRRYGPALVCKYLSKDEDGVSLAGLCRLFQDKVLMESWYFLKDVVIEEGSNPFTKAHAMTIFEYLKKDLRFKVIFNTSMSDQSTMIMKNILESYSGFEEFVSIVDVGGGVGASLSMIVSKYPSIKGINFDLPHVISQAPSFPGVDLFAGDMFESVPSGDAIFLKWILHGWSDECCLKLLKNCWKALPETGKVIVVEGMLSTSPESSTAAKAMFHFDMIMLANPAGMERTEHEFRLMAIKAGFSQFKVACHVSNMYVLEFIK